ncbi:beta-propeller fold lactonase family protein [Curvibacter gracilis]|uniref:beta-propeller fold lactonase family protein n=1 Tax=Curvibacter gracilis TaxID=230310 RepID=UPI000485BD70|nr:beta-propeller fold lactonase family protein [Curvibacter gracilis]
MLVLLAGLALGVQAAPYAYLTTSGANVSAFDLATNTVERTLTLPGSAGTGVAVNRQGTRVYLAGVPSRGIQIPSLHVIDATTNTVLPSIALNGPSGAQWSGVAVNPAGDRIYVAQPTGRYIAVVDPGTSQVLTTIAVSGSPANLALNASGTRLYVANASSGAGDSVLVLDTQTYATIATVPVTSGPSDLSFNPQGTRLYVTHPQFNTVSVVDTTTNTLVTSLSMGFSPTALVVSRDGSKVYVSDYTYASASVAVIDATTNTVVRSIPVGRRSTGIGISPDGRRVLVSNFISGNVSLIDTASRLAGQQGTVTRENLAVMISRVRRKIALKLGADDVIKASRGYGYRLSRSVVVISH